MLSKRIRFTFTIFVVLFSQYLLSSDVPSQPNKKNLGIEDEKCWQLIENSRKFYSSEIFFGKDGFNDEGKKYRIDPIEKKHYEDGVLPNRLEALVYNNPKTEELAVKFAEGTRVCISQKVLQLYNDFLVLKKNKANCETDAEKDLYEDMTLPEFVVRLVTKRPYVCIGSTDQVWTKNNQEFTEAVRVVGTKGEKKGFSISDYLSYDEVMLGSLCVITGKNFCIDNGSRGVIFGKGQDPLSPYEKVAVVADVVAPRFEKQGYMDYEHVVLTRTQNTLKNGYGKDGKNPILKLFAGFYNLEYFETYDDADCAQGEEHKKCRFEQLPPEKNNPDCKKFDTLVYEKRLKISIEVALKDACSRAEKDNKDKVYFYAAGIGLGEWLVIKQTKDGNHDLSSCYTQICSMMKVYQELIASKNFEQIKVINFGWFPEKPMKKWQESLAGKQFIKKMQEFGVEVLINQNNRFDKLPEKYSNYLLYTIFAGDANSLPGNEFYRGKFNGSDEPSTAKSSTITEFFNHEVNYALVPNIVKIVKNMMVKMKLPSSGISWDDVIKKSTDDEKMKEQMLEYWNEIDKDKELVNFQLAYLTTYSDDDLDDLFDDAVIEEKPLNDDVSISIMGEPINNDPKSSSSTELEENNNSSAGKVFHNLKPAPSLRNRYFAFTAVGLTTFIAFLYWLHSNHHISLPFIMHAH